MRRARCDACRSASSPYCEHRGVLVVFVDGKPITIISASEEHARATANRLRVKLKGKKFNPPRVKQ